MEPVTTVTTAIAVLDKAFGIADKLLAKTPNYPQEKKEDYLEIKANFDSYKQQPLEFQVNSYTHNLLMEVMTHQNAMVDAI